MGKHSRGMRREHRTIEAMIGLFCRGCHGGKDELCDECLELLEYARKRLDRCPCKEAKPACSRCPVHCYRPDMRHRIRQVMKYSGPRMLYRHPFLALVHLMDARRNPPERPRPKDSPGKGSP